jgi:hypothetical protein
MPRPLGEVAQSAGEGEIVFRMLSHPASAGALPKRDFVKNPFLCRGARGAWPPEKARILASGNPRVHAVKRASLLTNPYCRDKINVIIDDIRSK